MHELLVLTYAHACFDTVECFDGGEIYCKDRV